MQAIFHSLRGGSPETESSRGIFRRTDKLHVGFRPNLDGRGVTAGACRSLAGGTAAASAHEGHAAGRYRRELLSPRGAGVYL
jgi:hypothetical protein